MTNFKIAVVSDTVCPWCFVGRKKLLTAQQLWKQRYPSSNDTFSVTYAPYQLAPEFPRGPNKSKDKAQVYAEKFGPERTAMIHERLRMVGEDTGIAFKFGGKTGNTRDSHRLIHLAKKHGEETQLKTVDGLFTTYFENEGDITDYEVLRRVATGAGISNEEFQKAIVDSDEGGEEVDKQAAYARAGGVSGVPNYKIQGKFELSGARDPTEFLSVFERVKQLEK